MSGDSAKKLNKILPLLGAFGLLVFAVAIVLSLTIKSAPPTGDSSSEISSSAQQSNEIHAPIAMPLTDEEFFTGSAFIGNSCVERLFVQGYGLQADFLSGVGLTVHTAFTNPPARLDRPVTDLLADGRQYSRIFILFGINEVGTDPTVFIEKYGQLIDHIKANQPSAQIYVQAILPVSRAAHERNLYLVNNDNIHMFNQLIVDMTNAKQVNFLNTYEALADAEGFLPDDASSDGIHLSKDYNQVWINYLKEHVR